MHLAAITATDKLTIGGIFFKLNFVGENVEKRAEVFSEFFFSRSTCSSRFGRQVRATGPIDNLTHQPVKGRKMAGGIRFGEMERDAMLAHGASFLLQDRLLNCSDRCMVGGLWSVGGLWAAELLWPLHGWWSVVCGWSVGCWTALTAAWWVVRGLWVVCGLLNCSDRCVVGGL